MITWSHPELYNMYAIIGYSLQFKKFGSQKWSQFVFTLGEDHRITDLEQDTPYFVKSENEFGRGLPSEGLELRTRKGRVLTEILPIDLFSLYVLFSHFRPRDATRGNSFFQMSSYALANVRITNEKTEGKFPRGLKWENKMYKLKRSIV